MRLGLFMMPLHPPGKPVAEAYEEDLQLLVHADRLGLDEAWVGEHFTSVWENIPAPDLLIAKALGLTRRLVLGTGVALLPFHDPVVLAHRVAVLDHLARGRFAFGIGSGGVPTDFELFGIDPRSGQQRAMTREAIEVITGLWRAEGPFAYEGRFFRVRTPEPRPDMGLGVWLRPYQRPHPPIAVAGSSRESETLELAGEHGWTPMSINFLPPSVLPQHWAAVEKGAARSGQRPSRRAWRIARDVYVAETSAQARRDALEGALRRDFEEYFRTLIARGLRGLAVFKEDLGLPDEAVTPEYLLERVWIVGDPQEVAAKLRALYETVGGFGTLLVICHDWEPPERGLRSLELLTREVLPRLADLEPPS